MADERSQKQERKCRASDLRALGKTWVEIADEFSNTYGVNPRVAFRYAHGWSQSEVAERWNSQWPEERPKSFKAVSNWERWPEYVHAPSLETLSRLAEVYECSVGDLLADCPDFREAHTAKSIQPAAALNDQAVGAETAADIELLNVFGIGAIAKVSAKPSGFIPGQSNELLSRLQEIDFTELAQVIVMWVERINPSISRRSLLFKLSTALAVAAAAPIFDMTDPDERDRVRLAIKDPSRIDLATLTHTEEILRRCRRQGDVLGPEVALQTAISQRQIIGRILSKAPGDVLPRAQAIYAEISQLVGWLMFNLGDYKAAEYYYNDARSYAHDAEDLDLATYVLCTMSQLATWRGKPRVGIDHAIAAGAWAARAGNPRAMAYAADVAAQAYAADHQERECLEALDREQSALTLIDADRPTGSWWYFFDESFYWATKSSCALRLNRPAEALDAVTRSLRDFDASNLHNYALTMLFRGEAYLQQEDVEEAAQVIGDVATITAVNSAVRIDQRIGELRGGMEKWKRTKAVRQLDERLLSCRVAAG